MFADLVVELLSTFDRLGQACRDFAQAVEADAQLPVILPTFNAETEDLTSSNQARVIAAQSLAQLWKDDADAISLNAGLICASARTITAAEYLNQCKDAFQATIKKIRQQGTGDKSRIDTLIERALHKEGRRTDELNRALKQARINRLDLLKCYAHVRILPPNLRSISWTWAKTHSAIVSISHQEAVAMATKLSNPSAQHAALSLLAKIPSGERLAMKKKLPNQLRANLVWQEGDLIRRKAVTISGIVLSPDNKLPDYVWRDNPDKDDIPPRITRWDTRIDPEVYIHALNIHRYNQTACQ